MNRTLARAAAVCSAAFSLLIPGLIAGTAPAALAAGCTLSKDASTPAVADSTGNTSGSVTSASFSPPAGSLLVAVVNVTYKATVSTAPTLTVTDSKGGTWTEGPNAYDTHFDGSAVFERYLSAAPGSMTVSFSTSNHSQAGLSLAVEVVDGAASSQAGAGQSATGFGGGAGPGDESSITTTQAGSLVFVGSGWSTDGSQLTPDSATTTLQDYVDSTDITQMLTGQSAATTTPGAETLGWRGTVSEYSSWAAQEVLPAASCGGGGGTAPAVTTSAASGITASGATLNGSVNPEGASTTYKFDYGTTTSYGSSAPATPGSAGSGTSAVSESQAVSGLTASTTYHYRIEATNATGTSFGSDQTFTTSASGPFKLAWQSDFSTSYPLGTFASATENSSSVPGWGAYPSGWPDTATERGYSVGGHYDPGGTAWISGGQMHIKMFRDSSGDVHSCAMVPLAAFGQTYGKYVETFQVESPSTATGYKSAHLLYSTGSQNNEIDYPEAQWDDPDIYAFTHMRQFTSSQQSFNSGVSWSGWHTSEIDWTPSGLTFYMDGRQIGTTSVNIPDTPMKWVLQNETALNGEIPAIGSSAQMDISSVAYYSYTG